MEVQLGTMDEFLEELTIPKAYRDRTKFFSTSNANFLSPHRDEDYAIRLKPRKTPPFGLFYNLSYNQPKTLFE